jgi:hypothetical protein
MGMDARLRVEFLFDPEAANWNFRVPALGIIGGGCDNREEAGAHALDAIKYALAEESDAEPESDLVVEAVYLDLRIAS